MCLFLFLPVCLPACVYLRNHTTELHPIFDDVRGRGSNFFAMVATRDELPVLWMKPQLHINTTATISNNFLLDDKDRLRLVAGARRGRTLLYTIVLLVCSEEELTSVEDSHVVSSSYEWLGVTVDARNTEHGSRIVVCSLSLTAGVTTIRLSLHVEHVLMSSDLKCVQLL